MQKTYDILKLRTLLCFLNREQSECSVSKIARTLGEENYTISRILMALEKEGLVDRKNARSPSLTEQGKMEARKYEDRIRISMNHMIYEGVDIHSAQKDAYYWALYNSEEAMRIFREEDEIYRVKHELSERKRFTGDELCRLMKDGVYQFPFMIYREEIKNGSNISWVNRAFENTCTLSVKDGKGMLRLYPKEIKVKNPLTEKMESKQVRYFKYKDLGEEISAEHIGTAIIFPISSLNFVNIGTNVQQILHGSTCIKIGESADGENARLMTAIFTILI